MVWGSNGAINLWNGTTTTQLTDNSYANMDPQINDYGHVVWVGDPSYGSESEIYLYDGTNTIQLTDDDYDDHSPMINNNGDVVWSSYDGTDYELILYDGTNTTSLGNVNYNSIPQINDNGDVVWYGYDGTDYEIYFYDGTTSITTPLTNNSYNDRAPQINNNGDVVWNSNGQINLWNGTTTTQLSDFVGALTSVHINDHGHVVWASNGEINLWNGTTTIQLTNNGNSNYNPMISESGYVVWQGGIGSDYEIYFYDGASIIQLTDNNFHDGNQQISDNGHVVWQSGGASHYDIYYFQPYNPHGDVTINTDGTFTYSPDSGFYGQAGFGYMVDDGNGGTDTAIVTLDVANVAGTTGDDILYGTNLNDTMDGFAGNDEIYGYEGNDVLIGGSGDDTFLFTDSSSVDTVRDFTAQGSGIGNENDVLKFIESNVEGDTEWLEFNAQGNNTDNYISANSTNPADSTAYKIIGVTDTVVDWSNSSVLSVLNNAVDTTAANENDDGTYLIASNGTNSRVYFWEGDTNPESGDINDKIDESELTYFVDLEDFNSTDIDNLDELNFQIV